MKWSELPLNPTPRMLRQFSAAWLVFFLAAGLHRAFLRGQPTAGCVLCVLCLLGVAGLLKPRRVRWLFVGASVVAFPIGWVVTQAVLAILFYLVLTPVGLWFRWRGRDPLQLRPKGDRPSAWIGRGAPAEPGRYLKQY
jgi:hypothetical protein